MTQERLSVFETNSSSTHSICIATDRNTELKIPSYIVFKPNEFGWEIDKLNTTEEKASYLYSSILSLFDREETNELTAQIIDNLADAGVECEFVQPNDYFDYAVDHAGEGDHLEFIRATCRNKGRLMRYLFSDRSFVITSNDNGGYEALAKLYPECEAHTGKIIVDYPHETYYKGN